MQIDLRTDGPHNPEYTREVGNALAECVRVLNHGTLSHAPALEFPRDADRLLRDVLSAVDRMPQLLDQVRHWLHAQHAADRVGHDQGHDASLAVHITERALNTAIGHLTHAADEMRTATAETSHLTGLGGSDE